MIKYLVDVGDLKIHEVDFIQDGDKLKQIDKISDTVRILQEIDINEKSIFFDTVDWRGKIWIIFVKDDFTKKRFDIYDNRKEAEERLKEIMEGDNEVKEN